MCDMEEGRKEGRKRSERNQMHRKKKMQNPIKSFPWLGV